MLLVFFQLLVYSYRQVIYFDRPCSNMDPAMYSGIITYWYVDKSHLACDASIKSVGGSLNCRVEYCGNYGQVHSNYSKIPSISSFYPNATNVITTSPSDNRQHYMLDNGVCTSDTYGIPVFYSSSTYQCQSVKYSSNNIYCYSQSQCQGFNIPIPALFVPVQYTVVGGTQLSIKYKSSNCDPSLGIKGFTARNFTNINNCIPSSCNNNATTYCGNYEFNNYFNAIINHQLHVSAPFFHPQSQIYKSVILQSNDIYAVADNECYAFNSTNAIKYDYSNNQLLAFNNVNCNGQIVSYPPSGDTMTSLLQDGVSYLQIQYPTSTCSQFDFIKQQAGGPWCLQSSPDLSDVTCTLSNTVYKKTWCTMLFRSNTGPQLPLLSNSVVQQTNFATQNTVVQFYNNNKRGCFNATIYNSTLLINATSVNILNTTSCTSSVLLNNLMFNVSATTLQSNNMVNTTYYYDTSTSISQIRTNPGLIMRFKANGCFDLKLIKYKKLDTAGTSYDTWSICQLDNPITNDQFSGYFFQSTDFVNFNKSKNGDISVFNTLTSTTFLSNMTNAAIGSNPSPISATIIPAISADIITYNSHNCDPLGGIMSLYRVLVLTCPITTLNCNNNQFSSCAQTNLNPASTTFTESFIAEHVPDLRFNGFYEPHTSLQLLINTSYTGYSTISKIKHFSNLLDIAPFVQYSSPTSFYVYAAPQNGQIGTLNGLQPSYISKPSILNIQQITSINNVTYLIQSPTICIPSTNTSCTTNPTIISILPQSPSQFIQIPNSQSFIPNNQLTIINGTTYNATCSDTYNAILSINNTQYTSQCLIFTNQQQSALFGLDIPSPIYANKQIMPLNSVYLTTNTYLYKLNNNIYLSCSQSNSQYHNLLLSNITSNTMYYGTYKDSNIWLIVIITPTTLYKQFSNTICPNGLEQYPNTYGMPISFISGLDVSNSPKIGLIYNNSIVQVGQFAPISYSTSTPISNPVITGNGVAYTVNGAFMYNQGSEQILFYNIQSIFINTGPPRVYLLNTTGHLHNYEYSSNINTVFQYTYLGYLGQFNGHLIHANLNNIYFLNATALRIHSFTTNHDIYINHNFNQFNLTTNGPGILTTTNTNTIYIPLQTINKNTLFDMVDTNDTSTVIDKNTHLYVLSNTTIYKYTAPQSNTAYTTTTPTVTYNTSLLLPAYTIDQAISQSNPFAFYVTFNNNNLFIEQLTDTSITYTYTAPMTITHIKIALNANIAVYLQNTTHISVLACTPTCTLQYTVKTTFKLQINPSNAHIYYDNYDLTAQIPISPDFTISESTLNCALGFDLLPLKYTLQLPPYTTLLYASLFYINFKFSYAIYTLNAQSQLCMYTVYNDYTTNYICYMDLLFTNGTIKITHNHMNMIILAWSYDTITLLYDIGALTTTTNLNYINNAIIQYDSDTNTNIQFNKPSLYNRPCTSTNTQYTLSLHPYNIQTLICNNLIKIATNNAHFNFISYLLVVPTTLIQSQLGLTNITYYYNNSFIINSPVIHQIYGAHVFDTNTQLSIFGSAFGKGGNDFNLFINGHSVPTIWSPTLLKCQFTPFNDTIFTITIDSKSTTYTTLYNPKFTLNILNNTNIALFNDLIFTNYEYFGNISNAHAIINNITHPITITNNKYTLTPTLLTTTNTITLFINTINSYTTLLNLLLPTITTHNLIYYMDVYTTPLLLNGTNFINISHISFNGVFMNISFTNTTLQLPLITYLPISNTYTIAMYANSKLLNTNTISLANPNITQIQFTTNLTTITVTNTLLVHNLTVVYGTTTLAIVPTTQMTLDNAVTFVYELPYTKYTYTLLHLTNAFITIPFMNTYYDMNGPISISHVDYKHPNTTWIKTTGIHPYLQSQQYLINGNGFGIGFDNENTFISCDHGNTTLLDWNNTNILFAYTITNTHHVTFTINRGNVALNWTLLVLLPNITNTYLDIQNGIQYLIMTSLHVMSGLGDIVNPIPHCQTYHTGAITTITNDLLINPLVTALYTCENQFIVPLPYPIIGHNYTLRTMQFGNFNFNLNITFDMTPPRIDLRVVYDDVFGRLPFINVSCVYCGDTTLMKPFTVIGHVMNMTMQMSAAYTVNSSDVLSLFTNKYGQLNTTVAWVFKGTTTILIANTDWRIQMQKYTPQPLFINMTHGALLNTCISNTLIDTTQLISHVKVLITNTTYDMDVSSTGDLLCISSVYPLYGNISSDTMVIAYVDGSVLQRHVPVTFVWGVMRGTATTMNRLSAVYRSIISGMGLGNNLLNIKRTIQSSYGNMTIINWTHDQIEFEINKVTNSFEVTVCMDVCLIIPIVVVVPRPYYADLFNKEQPEQFITMRMYDLINGQVNTTTITLYSAYMGTLKTNGEILNDGIVFEGLNVALMNMTVLKIEFNLKNGDLVEVAVDARIQDDMYTINNVIVDDVKLMDDGLTMRLLGTEFGVFSGFGVHMLVMDGVPYALTHDNITFWGDTEISVLLPNRYLTSLINTTNTQSSVTFIINNQEITNIVDLVILKPVIPPFMGVSKTEGDTLLIPCLYCNGSAMTFIYPSEIRSFDGETLEYKVPRGINNKTISNIQFNTIYGTISIACDVVVVYNRPVVYTLVIDIPIGPLLIALNGSDFGQFITINANTHGFICNDTDIGYTGTWSDDSIRIQSVLQYMNQSVFYCHVTVGYQISNMFQIRVNEPYISTTSLQLNTNTTNIILNGLFMPTSPCTVLITTQLGVVSYLGTTTSQQITLFNISLPYSMSTITTITFPTIPYTLHTNINIEFNPPQLTMLSPNAAYIVDGPPLLTISGTNMGHVINTLYLAYHDTQYNISTILAWSDDFIQFQWPSAIKPTTPNFNISICIPQCTTTLIGQFLFPTINNPTTPLLNTRNTNQITLLGNAFITNTTNTIVTTLINQPHLLHPLVLRIIPISRNQMTLPLPYLYGTTAYTFTTLTFNITNWFVYLLNTTGLFQYTPPVIGTVLSNSAVDPTTINLLEYPLNNPILQIPITNLGINNQLNVNNTVVAVFNAKNVNLTWVLTEDILTIKVVLQPFISTSTMTITITQHGTMPLSCDILIIVPNVVNNQNSVIAYADMVMGHTLELIMADANAYFTGSCPIGQSTVIPITLFTNYNHTIQTTLCRGLLRMQLPYSYYKLIRMTTLVIGQLQIPLNGVFYEISAPVVTINYDGNRYLPTTQQQTTNIVISSIGQLRDTQLTNNKINVTLNEIQATGITWTPTTIQFPIPMMDQSNTIMPYTVQITINDLLIEPILIEIGNHDPQPPLINDITVQQDELLQPQQSNWLLTIPMAQLGINDVDGDTVYYDMYFNKTSLEDLDVAYSAQFKLQGEDVMTITEETPLINVDEMLISIPRGYYGVFVVMVRYYDDPMNLRNTDKSTYAKYSMVSDYMEIKINTVERESGIVLNCNQNTVSVTTNQVAFGSHVQFVDNDYIYKEQVVDYEMSMTQLPYGGDLLINNMKMVINQAYKVNSSMLRKSGLNWIMNNEVLQYNYSQHGFEVDRVVGLVQYQFKSIINNKVFIQSCAINMILQCPVGLVPMMNQIRIQNELISRPVDAASICVSCLNGAECSELGKTAILPKNTGYYYDTASGEFMACIPAQICEQGGCTKGYTGIRCGLCATNYYRNGQECEQCPVMNVGLIIAAFVVIILLFTSGMAFMIKRGINVAALRILFDFGQYVFIFKGFGLGWPAVVVAFFSIFNFLNFNIEIARPECMANGGVGFYSKYTVMMILPAGISLIIILIPVWISPQLNYPIKWFITKTQNMVKGITIQQTRIRGIRDRFCKVKVTLSLDYPRGVLKKNVILSLKVLLLFLQIVYVSVSSWSLSFFDCQTVGNNKYLAAEPATLCYDAKWNSYLGTGIITLLLYTIGIPSLVIGLYYCRVQNRFDNPLMLKFKDFANTLLQGDHNAYKPGMDIFIAVVMFLKLIMVFSKLFFTNYTSLQAICVQMALSVYLWSIVHYKPYKDRILNYTDIMCQTTAILVLSSGVLYYTSVQFLDDETVLTVSALLITMMSICVFVIIFVVVLQTRKMVQVQKEKRRSSILEGTEIVKSTATPKF